MAKKVIQVPMDTELIKQLDDFSQSRGIPRAELIRHACLLFLQNQQIEKLDKLYQEGYMKMPENAEIGSAQVNIMRKTMIQEFA